MVFSEFMDYTFWLLAETFRPMLSHQHHLSTMQDILSLTNYTFLIVDMLLLHTKKPVCNPGFSFTFPQKNVHPPAGLVLLLFHLTCIPTKPNLHFDSSFANVMCKLPYTDFLHSIYQISCPNLLLNAFLYVYTVQIVIYSGI
jgi:hypothetical protein